MFVLLKYATGRSLLFQQPALEHLARSQSRQYRMESTSLPCFSLQCSYPEYRLHPKYLLLTERRGLETQYAKLLTGCNFKSKEVTRLLFVNHDYASDMTLFASSDKGPGEWRIVSRPALPSKTKGPALLVGVIGPSSEPGVGASRVLWVKKSPCPMEACIGVIGRRKASCDNGKFNTWPSAVVGRGTWCGGVMPRVLRRISRFGGGGRAALGEGAARDGGGASTPVFSTESDDGSMAFLTDSCLEVIVASELSSWSISCCAAPGLTPSVVVSFFSSISDALLASSSSQSSIASGSSTSASRSATARQFGHKKDGKVL